MDIPRVKRPSRRTPLLIGGAVAIAAMTVGLAQLRPAAPTVERGTLWIDVVKRGEMMRDVRGNGTLVPEGPARVRGREAAGDLALPAGPHRVDDRARGPERRAAVAVARPRAVGEPRPGAGAGRGAGPAEGGRARAGDAGPRPRDRAGRG